ncbi:hypothetical protein MNB_SV-10-143 [hydrothermal vent metagenome]|uniref:Uncharacterized protein n=1 Tax=hydrothermal vent metagenome TaxID=652676 RepID=A0A1W1CU54_9ZZZZ
MFFSCFVLYVGYTDSIEDDDFKSAQKDGESAKKMPII